MSEPPHERARHVASGKLVVLVIALLAFGVGALVYRYLSGERVAPVKVQSPR